MSNHLQEKCYDLLNYVLCHEKTSSIYIRNKNRFVNDLGRLMRDQVIIRPITDCYVGCLFSTIRNLDVNACTYILCSGINFFELENRLTYTVMKMPTRIVKISRTILID